MLFISHRLDEIFAICDTVTVMRDGAVVHDAPVAEHDHRRDGPADGRARARRAVPEAGAEIGAPVLEVKRLTREGVFFDVSFEVRAGEIVALAGLVGAGRTEVARAIFGIDRPDAGHVEVAGTPAARRPARRRDARGDRVRARGPPHAGPGDGPVDRAQRDAHADARARAASG